MSEVTGTDQSEAESGHETFDELSRSLDGWRARIDELLVQVNLASLDARDGLRERAKITENAYLAAKSQLAELGKDVKTGLGSTREATQQLLHDLRQVYEVTEAAVRRGLEE